MLPLFSALLLAAASRTPTVPVDSVRVPILVYHNIQPAANGSRVKQAQLTMRPEVFAAQMQYLKDHNIHVVSIAALMDALEGKRTLPSPAVVITFDDGRLNQYENAYPVLRKLGFTAAFFPFTHAIGRNPRYFTWAQLKEMQAAGMTIGSHTNLHVDVRRIKDAKTWNTEVVASRQLLQQKLGSSVDFFAYPFGGLSLTGDSVVKAAGYRAARAFSGGGWNKVGDRTRLHAVPMTEDMAHFRRSVDAPGTPAVLAPAGGRGRGPSR